jgi:hypothetical protein
MPNPIKRIASSATLAALLKYGADRQVDVDQPKVVFPTHRSGELKKIALEFASEGREDSDAVSALRLAAGSHRKDLVKAGAELRFDGFFREDRTQNRAHRLISAAVSDGVVVPVTAHEEELFERTEELKSLPVDVAFSSLASLQPKLGELVGQVQSAWSASTELNDEERLTSILRFSLHGLGPLVGPDAVSTDPLVKSQLAFGIGRVHLLRSIGFADAGS